MFLPSPSATHPMYDVIVIGGGMVGSPLALALQGAGFKTLLIEKQALNQASVSVDSKSFDRRATAMSLGSIEMLQALNLWDEQQIEASPIKRVHVSEKGKIGTTKLDASQLGVKHLGAVVGNNSFGNFLLNKLDASELQVLDQCQIKSIDIDTECATLKFEHKMERFKLRAQLAIAVDGANSESAKLLGIQYDRKPYAQHALIANIETELENEGVAFERFAQPGPIAMLPIGERESALVWTLSDDQIETYLEMNDKEFCAALTKTFGERLGQAVSVGKRVSYPLVLSQAKELYRSRVLLAGNAAHSLHPVAGQGFNLALRGVATLLQRLSDERNTGNDYSATSVLRAIADAHRKEQFKIVNFSDQLIEIFAEHSSIPAWGRAAGLIGLNGIDAFKQEFARHAMGRAQPLRILNKSEIQA